jgi:hypothetical protein
MYHDLLLCVLSVIAVCLHASLLLAMYTTITGMSALLNQLSVCLVYCVVAVVVLVPRIAS